MKVDRELHEVERHRVILNAVEADGFKSIADLVGLTGASASTIRRDIIQLDGAGRVKRLRGGARAQDESPGGQQPPSILGQTFAQNRTRERAQKQAIARAAADLCSVGEAVILSGGTTIFEMGPELARKKLQVLTNSYPLGAYLLENSDCTVSVPGGIVYREQNIILSPYADQQAEKFHADKMFLGAAAIKPDGILEADPLITQSVQRLLACAEEVIICADATKFGRSASLVLTGLSKVSTIITDDRLSDADKDAYEALGVRVLRAAA